MLFKMIKDHLTRAKQNLTFIIVVRLWITRDVITDCSFISLSLHSTLVAATSAVACSTKMPLNCLSPSCDSRQHRRLDWTLKNRNYIITKLDWIADLCINTLDSVTNRSHKSSRRCGHQHPPKMLTTRWQPNAIYF